MLIDGVEKINSKTLEDGVKKMLDQRWRRKFPLLSPRRSHNWRRSIKENDPRAAATKMSSHNVQTPDTCLMSDVYHHSPSHCQVDNNPSQEHFGATKISSYLSIKANDPRAATTKISSHLNRTRPGVNCAGVCSPQATIV